MNKRLSRKYPFCVGNKTGINERNAIVGVNFNKMVMLYYIYSYVCYIYMYMYRKEGCLMK